MLFGWPTSKRWRPVETGFQFQLTHRFGVCKGADGFAFVLQNAGPSALGGRGMAGGFGVTDPTNPRHAGIPWSIAVFFDTCRNPEEGDPSSNYIAICTAGRPAEMIWPAKRLAFTPNLSVRLKDRRVHTARIVFEPPVLSVYLDGSAGPVLKTVVDLSIVMDRQGRAWVGFTASTGWGWQNHDILNWPFDQAAVSSSVAMVSSDITFSMSACLPNRNLCTPERAIAERSDRGYHIVLPANLEWGASIPNSSGRPVALTNAHGIVCWDFQARGSGGCSGPSGNGARAGTGFLGEDLPAGALTVKTHAGRIWFSVNGRHDSFDDNQGFYEFDVELR
ncbi:MAG: L-type lectin-domain containing protein [Bryobacteraceae bacterium]